VFKIKIMKITRIRYDYDSNKHNDTINCDCKIISVTKIRRFVLFGVSIGCMDKLYYDINTIT
jgi:hypothetical protein